jgi:molybdate transport system substrate-binding protein
MSMMLRTFAVVALLLASVLSSAQEITVAAASDLSFALKEIAQKYEAGTGQKVKVTFGSSGNFLNAIKNGAPYDIFLSADVGYPTQLETAGLTEPETLYEYAVGRLVLWVPRTSPLDPSQGLKLLTDARVKKISIANPQHAPYGRAAVAAMKSAGVYDHVESKLVLGENISQAAQFVETGNADVGLLALSLAKSPTVRGKYELIPPATYPPIRQAAVVLKRSSAKDQAKKFLEFVKSREARAILDKYGFAAPQ